MTDGDTDNQTWPDSVEAALRYYGGMRWRQVLPPALRAGLALVDEVERLRAEAAEDCALLRAQIVELRELIPEVERLRSAEVELSRYRDAISEIIGCAHHEGLACRRDNHGWHGCCLARLRAARLGITAEPERRDEDDAA